MVGSIYFIEIPYSDFRQFKGRPILVFKVIDKNDFNYGSGVEYTLQTLNNLVK